ncbi:hypothetical protein Dda_1883 [Drechslerella dactyloides]|uniref:Uncharacterized protein n=1 Tax=Drechslerella dactyloides TaxID=74499 RepID=A0AAD6NMJ1_DREDA|nr:hypothetical protein Dda_1883 [Drechslerella dactyloides]
MQHHTRSSASISTSISIHAFLLLLLVAPIFAIAIPQTSQNISPALTTHQRHAVLPRQREFNWTQYFISECGDNYVVCDASHCCQAGNECLLGSQSGDQFCRSLTSPTGSAPSPTATNPPSSGGSKKAPIGAIVGGVLGGVALIGGICLCLCMHRRAHPPSTPAIPQAPIPNLPNVIEAKYPPTHDATYSGDKWLPGSFLYHNRNRSISATSHNGVTPDGYTNVHDQITKDQIQSEPLHIAELPTTRPTVELPGDDGYFASKPMPEPPLAPTSPTETTPMAPRRASIGRSPTNVKQFWRTSRGS